MAERRDEPVPPFFQALGAGSPRPRPKFCGMFCPVEGSRENKTIDFGSLAGGRGRVVARQRDVAGGDPAAPLAGRVAIRPAGGKEALQNLGEQEISPKMLYVDFNRETLSPSVLFPEEPQLVCSSKEPR